MRINSSNIFKEYNRFYIFFIFLVLFACIISIITDIPFLRQILCLFVFLFFPGWLILKINKDQLSLSEEFVLSIGLSVSYLMFLGLMANWVFLDLGFSRPLSANSIMPILIVGIVILVAVLWHRNFELIGNNFNSIKLIFQEPLLFGGILFPIVSVIGAELMNYSDNNSLLLAVYLGMAIYVALLILLRDREPVVYSAASWALGLSLIFMYSLRSEHILGYDVYGEYALCLKILDLSYWDANSLRGPLSDCLSVVILPPIIKILFNIDCEYVYKIIFALIFSITPIIVFLISSKYIYNKLAFASAFFFMSEATFAMSSQSNPRTAISLLFFALFIFVLFSENICGMSKAIYEIIFAASIVVSHYSTSYIFVAAIAGSFLFALAITNRTTKNCFIRSGIIFISMIMIFVWYAQVSDLNFTNCVFAIKSMFLSLGNSFMVESRHEGTLKVMGVGAKSICDILFSVSHYIASIMIGLGILYLLHTILNRVVIRDAIFHQLDTEYLGMQLVGFLMLVAIIVVPNLSQIYTADRLWTQSMIVLSFPFVIGFCAIFRNHRNILNLALVLVLLFYFANANYLVYQINGEPRSLILNSHGQDYAHFFVRSSEITSVKWLSKEMKQGSIVYSDFDNGKRLSFGPKGSNWHSITFFQYKNKIDDNNYLYLSYSNIISGNIFTGINYAPIRDYKELFDCENKIYDNGNSQIYGSTIL